MNGNSRARLSGIGGTRISRHLGVALKEVCARYRKRKQSPGSMTAALGRAIKIPIPGWRHASKLLIRHDFRIRTYSAQSRGSEKRGQTENACAVNQHSRSRGPLEEDRHSYNVCASVIGGECSSRGRWRSERNWDPTFSRRARAIERIRTQRSIQPCFAVDPSRPAREHTIFC
jgi:hypothetical protein